jgi:TonB family protein
MTRARAAQAKSIRSAAEPEAHRSFPQHIFGNLKHMLFPRPVTKLLSAVLLLATASLSFSSSLFEARARQQQSAASIEDEAARGIELYKRGDDKGAIEVLLRVVELRGEDIAAWHFLGLAYSRQGKAGDARKAHERAAESGYKLLELLYASSDNPPITAKSESLLELAAESMAEFIKLSPRLSGGQREEWEERMELLRDYAKLTDDAGNPIKTYSGREVDSRAKILSRPAPIYPRGARGSGAMGVIVLRAIFTSDGKVRNIRVVNGLPNGITLSAIRAARQIKFIPATLNGNPVSQRVQIEYNFQLY